MLSVVVVVVASVMIVMVVLVVLVCLSGPGGCSCGPGVGCGASGDGFAGLRGCCLGVLGVLGVLGSLWWSFFFHDGGSKHIGAIKSFLNFASHEEAVCQVVLGMALASWGVLEWF